MCTINVVCKGVPDKILETVDKTLKVWTQRRRKDPNIESMMHALHRQESRMEVTLVRGLALGSNHVEMLNTTCVNFELCFVNNFFGIPVPYLFISIAIHVRFEINKLDSNARLRDSKTENCSVRRLTPRIQKQVWSKLEDIPNCLERGHQSSQRHIAASSPLHDYIYLWSESEWQFLHKLLQA